MPSTETPRLSRGPLSIGPLPRVHTTTLPFGDLEPFAPPTDTRNLALARPDIGSPERELVSQVLCSDVLAMGPFARRFETALAPLTGRCEAAACSRGTVGLHIGATDADASPNPPRRSIVSCPT